MNEIISENPHVNQPNTGHDKPEASVLIVNWNGKSLLDRCLDALSKQTFENYEIIIIDNHSSDGSVEGLDEKFHHLASKINKFRIIQLEENTGFAIANNIGAKQANGDWLLLLNNDAFPSPTWIESLLSTARMNPEYSSFASKSLQAGHPDLIDSAGIIYHTSGLSWDRGRDQLAREKYNLPVEVFGTCGAAAMYKRDVFLRLGGFDEDFGSYFEDTDLAFRLQLEGHRCLYVPEAIVSHIGSASFGVASDSSIYLQLRNWLWVYWKNTPGSFLWRFLVSHLAAFLVFSLYYLFRGNAKLFIKAKKDALASFKEIKEKRGKIQGNIASDPSTHRLTIQRINNMINHSWFSPYLLGRKSKKISGFRQKMKGAGKI